MGATSRVPSCDSSSATTRSPPAPLLLATRGGLPLPPSAGAAASSPPSQPPSSSPSPGVPKDPNPPAVCARLPSLCRAPDCRPCSAVFPREPACPAARAPPFTRCLVRLSRDASHFPLLSTSAPAFAHVWRQGKHCFHGKILTLDVPGP